MINYELRYIGMAQCAYVEVTINKSYYVIAADSCLARFPRDRR